MVIVGTDRTARNGDVCNKTGTYLKALAARANDVPFYVTLPESTIDWHCASGDDIPIEERGEAELLTMTGLARDGGLQSVALAPAGTCAHNPAFDVTPAGLVTALVTEHGSFEASAAGLELLRAQIFSSSPM
jgi:methylthioribose-1-phosphate isomerase